MTTLSQLDKAIILATKTHSGDYDKADKPYIHHVLRVAMNVDRVRKYPAFAHYTDEMVEKVRIVCFLHDTVEDSKDKDYPVTFNVLRAEGYDEDIVEGVDGMTKREGETYKESIQRAMQHPLSHMGKVCDLIDNMDLDRLKDCEPDVRKAGIKRVETRYKPAFETLLQENQESIIHLLAEMNKEKKTHLLTEEQIEKFLDHYSENMLDLTTKQSKAFRLAMTSSVSVLDGSAGTGVISTLKCIIEGIKRYYHDDAKIHVFTATGKARNVLSGRLGLEVKVPPQNNGIITGDLLIIDDPQLMSKSALMALLKQAHDIRVLFVTDLLMLSSMDGVDFNEVVKYSMIPITRLTEIVRQR